jgi:hypothetical protein
VEDQAKMTIRRQYSHLFTPSVRPGLSSSTAEASRAGLANAVDDSCRADPVFLGAKVVVELHQMLVEALDQRLALRALGLESRGGLVELADRVPADLLSPCPRGVGLLRGFGGASVVLATLHLLEELVLGPCQALLQAGIRAGGPRALSR